MTLEDRIVRLERQNRWIKCAAVVGVGLFFTLGQSKPQDEVRVVDPDGYEWSGSRPADQRYLWSHRLN